MKTFVSRIKSGIVFLIITLFSFSGNAQNNSPWRKINDEILIVKKIYFAPGCHQYSLTDGQGFSVYIKNKGTHTVFIKGNLVAKTYCGTDIISPFSVTLKANAVSNGGSYDSPDNNGQSGVVIPTDCKGVGYYVRVNDRRYKKPHYIRYSNRIKNVKITNVEITFLDSVLKKKEEEIAKPIKPEIKEEELDSLINRNLLWYQRVDSLTKEVGTLKIENNSLSDSLTYYKSMYNQQTLALQLAQQPPIKDKKKKKKKKNSSQ